jgi:hypothetical protein
MDSEQSFHSLTLGDPGLKLLEASMCSKIDAKFFQLHSQMIKYWVKRQRGQLELEPLSPCYFVGMSEDSRLLLTSLNLGLNEYSTYQRSEYGFQSHYINLKSVVSKFDVPQTDRLRYFMRICD